MLYWPDLTFPPINLYSLPILNLYTTHQNKVKDSKSCCFNKKNHDLPNECGSSEKDGL